MFDIAELLFGSVDIIYGVLGKIFWWGLIPLASVILRLVGGIMDYALSVSVLSSLYNNEAISIAWTVIRDITNMIFIFVLVFNGIKTILSIGNASVIKKTIINVVIAALLLNFSLFFSKVLIDTSNVTASWFIQGIQRIGGQESVSSSIRATLQMEKLTATYGDAHLDRKSFSLQSFTQGILLFILTCVAIYVLYKIADLIIGRIVAFIVLLITSPLGFTGVFLELGDLTDYAKKWWKEMMGQVFMLPMFFLMLYVTMFLVDRFDKLFASTNSSTGGAAGFEPVNYVMFIIIIMLLLKSLKTAEDYSGDIGAGFAKFAQQATGVVAGGIAMGTLGKGMTALKNNASFQKWSANSGVAGEMAMRATRSISGAEFGVKSSFGNLAKTAGIDKVSIAKDAFKGAEKGYSGKIDQEKKDLKEYVKSFGKGLPGAQNRKAYAENLKSGLYARVVSGGKGVVTGTVGTGKFVIDKVTGGTEVTDSIRDTARFTADGAKETLGYVKSGAKTSAQYVGNVIKQTPVVGEFVTGTAEIARGVAQQAKDSRIGKITSGFVGGTADIANKAALGALNSQGIAGAKKEIGMEASKEIDKEKKQIAQDAISKINDAVDHKNTIKSMLKELDEINENIAENQNNQEYLNQLYNKKTKLESKITAREKAVADQIADMKSKGFEFTRWTKDASGKESLTNIDENEEGLFEFIEAGKAVEQAETVSKLVELTTEKEAPKDDKSGGDSKDGGKK